MTFNERIQEVVENYSTWGAEEYGDDQTEEQKKLISAIKTIIKESLPKKMKQHKYLHNKYCECCDCNLIRRNNEHRDFWNACLDEIHRRLGI